MLYLTFSTRKVSRSTNINFVSHEDTTMMTYGCRRAAPEHAYSPFFIDSYFFFCKIDMLLLKRDDS